MCLYLFGVTWGKMRITEKYTKIIKAQEPVKSHSLQTLARTTEIAVGELRTRIRVCKSLEHRPQVSLFILPLERHLLSQPESLKATVFSTESIDKARGRRKPTRRKTVNFKNAF